MADNRFDDYPTKRLPDRRTAIADDKTKRLPGKEEIDDYPNHGYEETENYDTRPSSPQRRALTPEERRRLNRDGVSRQSRPGSSINSGNRKQIDIKATFSILYIVLLVIAIGLCILALFYGIRRLVTDLPVIDTPDSTISNDNDDSIEGTIARPGRPIERNFTAMITGISMSPRSLTLMNIEDTGNMETRTLPLSDNAEIVNRQNNSLTFSNLFEGKLVEITYDEREPAEIINIRESVHAREHTGTNVRVNVDNQTISVGSGAPLRFNSQTLVVQGDTRLNISQISAADSITILEYRGTAWHVRRDYSHGFLNVTNFSSISNGIITIGTRQLLLADLNEPITVAEGAHRVMVEGTNIETFIDNIVIVQGQTLELSLSNIEMRTGTLHIVTVPADAQIFIAGQQHTSPATLPFGEHTIRVQRDGYYTIERVERVDSSISNVRFDLEAMSTAATLEVITNPTGAQIFINDAPIGFSPLTHELDPGAHIIIARMQGYIDSTISITLAARQNDSRTLTLTPVPHIPIPDIDPDPDPIPDPPEHNPQNPPPPPGGWTLPPPPPLPIP